MNGTSNYYGIICDSGHKAALGIQFHITNVWRDTRPTQDEFKEVLRKAREMMAKDELWDNILEEMHQNDREERFCYAARKVRGYKMHNRTFWVDQVEDQDGQVIQQGTLIDQAHLNNIVSYSGAYTSTSTRYTTNSLSRIRMRAGKIRAATKRHNACNTGCGRSAGNQTRSGTT